MKKNRKKAETYRFNGNPHMHAGSIHSVEMPDLEAHISQFEAKLADPTRSGRHAGWKGCGRNSTRSGSGKASSSEKGRSDL
jgi:hypothetical protein